LTLMRMAGELLICSRQCTAYVSRSLLLLRT